jgi:hypothetical protein
MNLGYNDGSAQVLLAPARPSSHQTVRSGADMTTSDSIARRFWAKVNKTDTCWLWTGHIDRGCGYGKFTADWRKGSELAHRVSFYLAHGFYPKGETCHTCDVRACVRPDHLYDGTRSDNMRDAVARKRHWNVRKEACSKGHQFTPENTYVLVTPTGRRIRQCRECAVATKLRHARRRHAAKGGGGECVDSTTGLKYQRHRFVDDKTGARLSMCVRCGCAPTVWAMRVRHGTHGKVQS